MSKIPLQGSGMAAISKPISNFQNLKNEIKDKKVNKADGKKQPRECTT